MKHLARRRQLAVHHSQVCIQTPDYVDYPEYDTQTVPKENVFSVKSALLTISSMISYVFDMFSSAAVCYYLFQEHNPWWFIMTIVPISLSMLVVNGFSIRWYLHDYHESKFLTGDISSSHWVLRFFFHSVFLGPVIRYLELFVYGIHSLDPKDPSRESHKVMVLQEDRDTSMLALVGSFVKSAPQLVLQLYILMQNKRMVHLNTMHAQEVSVCVSIVTLSLALTSYHRALRRSTPSKLNMTITGTVLQFISHLIIISCRVLTLAAFASVHAYWLFVFLGVHWYVMTMWLIYQKTSFCATGSGERRTMEELLFNAIVAVIYVFCFLNVKDEPTKYKYTFYYLLVWIQNFVLATLFYWKADSELWFRLPLLISVIVGLIIGLSILMIYYRHFHPNKVSRVTTFVQVPS